MAEPVMINESFGAIPQETDFCRVEAEKMPTVALPNGDGEDPNSPFSLTLAAPMVDAVLQSCYIKTPF
jgi:hypothetical protein